MRKKCSILVAIVLTATLGYAAPASAAHVGCGDTITTNTSLDSNVGPCSGTGIIVGADNITLNLNGFEIFGVIGVPGEGAGVHLIGRTGVTVQNGSIRYFDAGVAIEGGSANRVQRLVIDRNEGDSSTDFGDGIAMNATTQNVIKNNVITRNAPFDGVGLFGAGGSDNNMIEANVISDNQGLRTIGPHGTTEEDDGVRLENGSQFNLVRRNVIERNGLDGIGVFFQSTDNRIINNVVRDNGFHDPPPPPTLDRPGDGIRVFQQADRTTIRGNVTTGNAARGIAVDSFNNTINANQSSGNVIFDLFDSSTNCDNNSWTNNVFGTANQACIN